MPGAGGQDGRMSFLRSGLMACSFLDRSRQCEQGRGSPGYVRCRYLMMNSLSGTALSPCWIKGSCRGMPRHLQPQFDAPPNTDR